MTYDLTVINNRIASTPKEYVMECEQYLNSRIRKAADEIVNNIDSSPIALLSGPSASGKTTTAKRLAGELKKLGFNAYNVSLDNYFLTVDPKTAPRTPPGDIDHESPSCLDMALLNEHFNKLAAGEEIEIPYFSFTQQARDPSRTTTMKLGKNDIAIFEGIHALNDCIAAAYPAAYKVYVSTITDISHSGNIVLRREQLRLLRRMVRDDFFRGADPEFTLRMWDNIRRGEQLYILPYKDKADFSIDTALPYEISIMKQFTHELFDKIPEATENASVLQQIRGVCRMFKAVDMSFVPADSILREFIGGSIFEY